MAEVDVLREGLESLADHMDVVDRISGREVARLLRGVLAEAVAETPEPPKGLKEAVEETLFWLLVNVETYPDLAAMADAIVAGLPQENV